MSFLVKMPFIEMSTMPVTGAPPSVINALFGIVILTPESVAVCEIDMLA